MRRKALYLNEGKEQHRAQHQHARAYKSRASQRRGVWRRRMNRQFKARVLTHNERTMISLLARVTKLPATDLFHVLADQLPHLTWQNMRNYMDRQGFPLIQLPPTEDENAHEGVPETRLFVEALRVSGESDKEYVMVCFDHVSKMLFAEVLTDITDEYALPFLRNVVQDLPYKVTAIARPSGELLLDQDQVDRLVRDGANVVKAHHFPVNGTLYRHGKQANTDLAVPCNDLPLFTEHVKYFIWKYNFGKSLRVLRGNSPYGDVVRKLNKTCDFHECMEYFIKLYHRFPHYEFQNQQISWFIRNQ